MLISHKKFEATYLKHHKEKEPKRFFSSLFCWPNKKEHAAQQNATTRCGEKSCPIQEKEKSPPSSILTPSNPTKNPPKIFLPSFHSIHFVTNHGNGPPHVVKCFYGLFLTRFVTLLAMFCCVVATIVVVFLFIVFCCFYINCCVCFFRYRGFKTESPTWEKNVSVTFLIC